MPALTRRGLLPLALGAAFPALGQPRLPDGPVTIIAPYTPGTGPDILARLISPVLQARLGQPVVVENRVGASGNIGTAAAARAAPDGRTLLLQANTFVMNPSLFRQVPYDPIADFAPVIHLTLGDLALLVNPDVPARDLRGFVDLARARPGALDYGSPGIGTPQHMAMELFRLAAGIELNHVPYRGTAPAVQDLIGRRLSAMVLPIHVAMPLVADNRVRILAVGGERRAEAAPEVPTLAEAGFPGTQADLWYGLLGPAGLPGELTARLNDILNEWLAEPATRGQLRAQGMTPTGGSPEAFASILQRDLDRWSQVVREARISAD